jgi:hypothetical protein
MRLWKKTAIILTTLTLIGCNNSDSMGNSAYSTPKKAAMTLAQALEAGDATAIKSASVGADPQVIDALAASMSAHRALADAATTKFGPAAKGFDNDRGTLHDFANRLADAQVTIDGDTAAITINGASTPSLKLKKNDGDWKTDLSQLAPEMAPSMQKMAAVTRQLAAEVSAGKYATIEAANQARLQMIKAAIQNMPTTRG